MDNKYIPAFLWIKSYKSIRNKDFHFTNEYTYTYDQDKNKLTRKKNNDYASDFYGDSISISAIVGENGAGKTTILSAIMECFNFSSKNAKCIIAFSNGVVWSNEEGISCFEFSDKEESLELSIDNRKKMYSYYEPKPPVSCLYYSQALDWSRLNSQNSSIIDLSSGNLLAYSETKRNRKSSNNCRDFFTDEFNKQLRFIEKADDKTKKIIGFKLPSYVKVSPVAYDVENSIESLVNWANDNLKNWNSDNLKTFFAFDKLGIDKGMSRQHVSNIIHGQLDDSIFRNYFEFYIGLLTQNQGKKNSKFEDYFKEYLAITMFCVIFNRFGGGYETRITYGKFVMSLCKTVKDKNFSKNDCWNNLGILYNYIDMDIKEITNEEYEEEIKHIRELKALYDYINNDMIPSINASFECEFTDSRTFDLSYSDDVKEKNLPFMISFKDFWKNYEGVSRFCDVFDCSWNLSSGEISRLELYSRLYDVIISERWRKGEFRVLYRAENSILLLFDGADMLLHPEWQRSLINDIVTVFPKIFPGQYISVIVATHSPIMLSDIPQQNVLFLDKTSEGIDSVNGCDTFASNIFQLFREGFFIGDTGIGVFAEKKLKDIVGYIHGKKDDSGKKPNDEEIRKLISAVGDAFLKNKLKDEYLLYCSKAKNVEKEQAAKIVQLESEKGELLDKQRKLVEQRNENLRKIKKALENYESHEGTSSEERKGSEKASEEISGEVRDLNGQSKEKDKLLDAVREILKDMDV